MFKRADKYLASPPDDATIPRYCEKTENDQYGSAFRCLFLEGKSRGEINIRGVPKIAILEDIGTKVYDILLTARHLKVVKISYTITISKATWVISYPKY